MELAIIGMGNTIWPLTIFLLQSNSIRKIFFNRYRKICPAVYDARCSYFLNSYIYIILFQPIDLQLDPLALLHSSDSNGSVSAVRVNDQGSKQDVPLGCTLQAWEPVIQANSRILSWKKVYRWCTSPSSCSGSSWYTNHIWSWRYSTGWYSSGLLATSCSFSCKISASLAITVSSNSATCSQLIFYISLTQALPDSNSSRKVWSSAS